MKRIPLFFVLLVLLSACCQKKKCESIDYVMGLEFYGFAPEDLDTVVVTGYSVEPGRTLTDSTWSSAYYITADKSSARMEKMMSAGNNWTVYVPATGKYYKLSDIELASAGCDNGCFLKKDKLQSVSSYKVNGVVQTTSYARIDK